MAKIKPRLLPKMMVPLLSTTGEEYTQSALIVVGLKLQSGPALEEDVFRGLERGDAGATRASAPRRPR